MTADDTQAREVEVVARAVGEHRPMIWSDRTVGCQGCAARVEATKPFDRSEYLRLCHGDGEPGWMWHQAHVAEAVLAALAPAHAAERQEAAREAWGQGYETGRDDEWFSQRGISTDSDAHEYPHANPYRADGVADQPGKEF